MDASLSMTRVGEDSEHSFVSFRLPARNDTSVFSVNMLKNQALTDFMF